MYDDKVIGNPLTLKETQIDTISILNTFDALCDSLNLTYWAMYGTLIGAIRHKGFIPWDDDLDVAMPRDDYERLLSYFKDNNNLVNGLYVDNPLNDSTCFFYISRICNKDHIVTFNNYYHQSGLFIDVYPFDGMGNDRDKEFWIKNKPRQIYKMQKRLELVNHKGILCGKGFLHKLLNIPMVLSARSRGVLYYFYKLDAISRKFSWDESNYVGLTGWAVWLRFLDKEWFSKTIRVPFEDTTIPIPYEFHKVLFEIYGDYMQLPPETSRKPHHDYSVYRISG